MYQQPSSSTSPKAPRFPLPPPPSKPQNNNLSTRFSQNDHTCCRGCSVTGLPTAPDPWAPERDAYQSAAGLTFMRIPVRLSMPTFVMTWGDSLIRPVMCEVNTLRKQLAAASVSCSSTRQDIRYTVSDSGVILAFLTSGQGVRCFVCRIWSKPKNECFAFCLACRISGRDHLSVSHLHF